MKAVVTALFLALSFSQANALITWSTTPTTISTTDVDATNVQVGIDHSGNAVAIWLEGGFVKASTQLVGGSWSELSVLSNSGATSPQLVVDLAGNATALWNESGALNTATQPSGGSWSTATSLASTGVSSGSLVVDATGNIVAIWAANGAIQSSTKLVGRSWSTTPDTLANTGASTPQVAIGSSGNVFAVWHATNPVSSMDAIYASSKTLSGTWSTATAVSNASQNCVYPQIAVDASGNGLAIWYRYTLTGNQYTNVFLQSSLYAASGFTWSTPVDVSSAGLRNPAELQAALVFSPAGNATALWTNSLDGSNYTLSGAFWSMDTSWNGVNNLTQDLFDLSFAYSIDQASSLYLANMFYNYSTSTITIQNSVSILDGITQNYWSTVATLSADNQNGYPVIAVTSNYSSNQGVAAWVSYNGSYQTIQALTGSGIPMAPPSNPIVTQSTTDYGVIQVYNNTISWDASPAATLGSYAVYRNGILLTQVPSNVLSVVDGNVIPNLPVTYSIASIDENTAEVSSFTSVTYP